MSDNSDSDRDYYHYDPALEAAAIFVAAYGITMLIHSVQLAQKRTWYFIPFFIGGLCETSLPSFCDGLLVLVETASC